MPRAAPDAGILLAPTQSEAARPQSTQGEVCCDSRLTAWQLTKLSKGQQTVALRPCRPSNGFSLPNICPARGISGADAIGDAYWISHLWSPLHGISPRAGICCVVREAARSEGNLPIRTSEAIGGAGFIRSAARIEPFDPAVVRASTGALLRQTFIRMRGRSAGADHSKSADQGGPKSPIYPHRDGA
jgi:hypothetical protein